MHVHHFGILRINFGIISARVSLLGKGFFRLYFFLLLHHFCYLIYFIYVFLVITIPRSLSEILIK